MSEMNKEQDIIIETVKEDEKAVEKRLGAYAEKLSDKKNEE